MRGLASLAGLVAAGVLSAAAMLWAFARFSDQARIRLLKRQMKASLYEMRLFVDEPLVLFRAQKQLIASNLLYLGLMLRPVLLMSAPMIVLMAVLDGMYGYRPLHSGESALLSVYVRPAADLRTMIPTVKAGSGVSVDSPVVRVPGEQRFCSRIRAIREGAGSVRVSLDGSVYDESVQAVPGFGWPARERVRSLWLWLLNPTEKRLPPGAVERIEIAYPAAGVTVLGVTLHWITWYALAVVFATILLRRRFGVTF